MVKKKIVNIAFLIFLLIFLSCTHDIKGTDNNMRLVDLQNENLSLQKKVDSLLLILNSETTEAIVLNNSHGKKLMEGDSVEVLIGMLYNRQYFIESIGASLITNSDTLDFIRKNRGAYQYQYVKEFGGQNELSASQIFKMPFIEGSIAVICGVLRVRSNTGINYIPIEYDLLY